VGWKSNQKNVELLERHLGDGTTPHRSNKWLGLVVVLSAIGLLVLVGAGIVAAVRYFFSGLRGFA
jgi:hypothetical protein